MDESPYGIRELAGGSRTWMLDVHPEGRRGRANDHERVARGGSFTSGPRFSRAASRSFLAGRFRLGSIGLRLVRLV